MDHLRNGLHTVIVTVQKWITAPPTVSRSASVASLVLIVGLAGLTVFFWPGTGGIESDQKKQISSSADGFVVKADYVGSHNWNFKVDGSFSNKCIDSDVAVEQTETEPEEVTVRLVAYRPSDETLCAQKIQEISHDGTFVASRDASITLEIDERESKESPTGLKLKSL